MQVFNCRTKKWEYVEPAPLTDEEIAEMERLQAEMERLQAEMPAPEPTVEERLTAIEEAMLELLGVKE